MGEMDWKYFQACWKALIEVIALLNISSLAAAAAAEWWLQMIFPFGDMHEILNTSWFFFSPADACFSATCHCQNYMVKLALCLWYGLINT